MPRAERHRGARSASARRTYRGGRLLVGAASRSALPVRLGSPDLLCVALWLYFLFFHGLGRRDLWNSHEARAAMNARSVLEDGRWLLPELHDGHTELQKPPLYYWLVAGFASAFGYSGSSAPIVSDSFSLPAAISWPTAVLVNAFPMDA